MSNIVLQAKQLYKTYQDGALNVPVLQGIDLSIQSGEMIAIVGASGAGKSTLLQLLGGLDRPTQGEVWLNNDNLASLSERTKSQLRNKHLGFIYQFHHLLPEFNALENVAMPLLISGLDTKLSQAQAEEMLNKVGLSHRLTHRVGELSGGERQRVAIARALVMKPQCILADEPTGNLDQHTAGKVFDLILELNSEFNTSFVMVTHNEFLAKQLHRRLTLQNGHLQ